MWNNTGVYCPIGRHICKRETKLVCNSLQYRDVPILIRTSAKAKLDRLDVPRQGPASLPKASGLGT